MYLGISDLENYRFGKLFFDTAKRYFLEKERLVNGKFMIRNREILNHKLLDDQVVRDFINTISYEEVKEIVVKIMSVDKKNAKRLISSPPTPQ
jgi:hypothetical protein